MKKLRKDFWPSLERCYNAPHSDMILEILGSLYKFKPEAENRKIISDEALSDEFLMKDDPDFVLEKRSEIKIDDSVFREFLQAESKELLDAATGR